jgi:hypothetical protein
MTPPEEQKPCDGEENPPARAGAGGAGVPLFATLLGGVVAALAVAVIWIELLLREVAIYAALLFFPSRWPGWRGRAAAAGRNAWPNCWGR